MMKRSELIKISEFCKTNWPAKCEKVLHTADEVCENRFLFDMPWDLERTEKTAEFGKKIDWYAVLDGDSEFLFEMNRHGFLLHLGQAYYMSNDERYAAHFCRLLEDWIANVPPDDGNNSPWRSLEVGFRAENWVRAMSYAKHMPCFNGSLKAAVEQSLQKHVEILLQSHTEYHMMSNWGIIQDCGLFAAASYLHMDSATRTALSRLERETQLQLMSDGVHWEQSCGYHNAVLMYLLGTMCFARQRGIQLPARLRGKILEMALVNLKWVRPDHRHPLLGDSDNNDIRDLLSRSALLFSNGELKSGGFDVPDYDSAWLLGMSGIEKYAALPAKKPDFLSACLPDCGSYIFRSGWGEKANWLCLHNGYAAGGHAHADKLHFDLMLCGRDVLVDSGRGTYKYTDRRREIKNASGHNCCVVGDKMFMEMTGPWSVRNPALSVQEPVFENEHCALAGGGHLGYLKSDGIWVERRILWIKPGIYVILDAFRGVKGQSCKQFFHFAPDGELTLQNNVALFSDGIVQARMHFLNGAADCKIIDSLYSPNYNTICKNKAVELSFCGEGDVLSTAVIFGGYVDTIEKTTVRRAEAVLLSERKSLDPSRAQGVVISTPDCEYTVCVANEELGSLFRCNSLPAAGSLTVYREDEIIFTKW